MKTYVKICGPPLAEALDELQKIAREAEITHYHFLMGYTGAPVVLDPLGEVSYRYPRVVASGDVTHPMFSKSGHTLGDYDFFFEWTEDLTWDEMREFITKIDKAFATLGCKYTLTTK